MTSPIVKAFREGLAAGDLLIQKCNACGKPNMYPRYACPFCQSEDLGWQKASGSGTLMSFTVLRAGAPDGFEDDLPYALGVIKLDEGVQMLARLVKDADGEWNSYRCDMSLRFAPVSAEQIALHPAAWFKA